jgi:hypothetical protein
MLKSHRRAPQCHYDALWRDLNNVTEGKKRIEDFFPFECILQVLQAWCVEIFKRLKQAAGESGTWESRGGDPRGNIVEY